MSRVTTKGINYIELYFRLAREDNRERGKADKYFMADKLSKLEDIEEQYGFPLEVLKPNQKVVFIKDNEILGADVMGINIQTKKIMIGSAWSFKELPLNQYNKTWWLKEDKEE